MGSRDSAKPILRLPERNEEYTSWTRSDGTKPVSAKNKLKCEDMGTVRERKALMWTEVAKNDQDSLVDRWLWDQIKPATWDKVAQVFPQRGQQLPQQNWVHRGYKVSGTYQVPTVWHPGEVGCRQAGQNTLNLWDSAENVSHTMGLLCPSQLYGSV